LYSTRNKAIKRVHYIVKVSNLKQLGGSVESFWPWDWWWFPGN